jgi:hypothetical protein
MPSASFAATASSQSWIQNLFKFGHYAKGLVYIFVGLVAFATAIGSAQGPSGPRDLIDFLRRQPFGQTLVVVLALGLLSYAAWRWIKAIQDPGGNGSDARGIAKRIGYAASGSVYAGLSLAALGGVFSSVPSGGENAKQDLVARVLASPWGEFAVLAAALCILGVAFIQAYRGLAEKFLTEIYLGELDYKKRQFIKNFGKAGHLARAVTFAIMSYFLFLAALRSNPSSVRGLEGALEFLQQNVYGIWLLGLVALGMLCYGVYMMVKAHYGKIGSVV